MHRPRAPRKTWQNGKSTAVAHINTRIQKIKTRMAATGIAPLRVNAPLSFSSAKSPGAKRPPFSTDFNNALNHAIDQLLSPQETDLSPPHASAGPSVSQTARHARSVPAALAAYGNGRIPHEALQPIGIGAHRLHAPAAGAFIALRATAARAGVHIGVTDSYRSHAAQVELAKRKGLYSQGGLAARPGTSQHGWGLSLDLDLNAPALAWMRQHAPAFGFTENVPREPWHWTYGQETAH